MPSAIAACLARLEEAIDAAEALGLDVADASTVRDTGRERLRFPGETYVLAMAGGTGVGKSSLLNALAGSLVSEAGARRPTTGTPVAWVPRATRSELGPLLEWLGVSKVQEHVGATGAPVAILDLPDLDSIAPEHRAQVDALLPRVDAVAWVVDPEKYADLLLHTDYLRAWAPRLARQVVVLNKADRVAPGERERLRADLRRRLRDDGVGDLDVLLTSAGPRRGGVLRSAAALEDTTAPIAEGSGTVDASGGTAELRGWLAGGAQAKEIVARRLAVDAGVALATLAVRAGVAGTGPLEPLVDVARRARTLEAIVGEAVALLDLPGLERQAVAATRQASRPSGGGPIGQVTSRLYRWSGRASVVADPAGFLRRWRERGTLTRTLTPLRELVAETLPRVPAVARPAVAALGEGALVQARVSAGIDRAVTSPAADFDAPTSRLWPLVGLLQYVATGAIVVGALWLLAIWLGAGPSSTADVPLLGAVPLPVLLIVGGVVAGTLLGRVVAVHAAWIGRRWARRLRETVHRELRTRLADTFAPLDVIEAARTRLDTAARAASMECRAPRT
ncbi:MAG: 50S ribosome-binding GTPase [Chloroflexi bacterium]|nr:50S ribosome-binding GTPase [Chloroflexota bacterium]